MDPPPARQEIFIEDFELFHTLGKEYVGEMDLYRLLRIKGKISICQSNHIITIFEYLHSKNIIYRDLKPENILIDQGGYLKLADFGFSKIINGVTYTLCGTPRYIAPEILLNKGHGKAVDWWSLGILLYEMLVGIDPFYDDDPMMIYENIIKGKINFPRNFDLNAKSLIKHLCKTNISKRYGCMKSGIKDVVNHKFFDFFNWRGLLYRNLDSPYIPFFRDESDFSDDKHYTESDDITPSISNNKDPFINW